MPVDTQALLPAVCDLARAAGAAILRIYESDDFDVQTKGDDSPLTRADLASNRVIVDGLRQLDASIPVLSEESRQAPYSERAGWSRYWLVDPMDGTKEFVKRSGEFTVNIALVDEGGVPVLGVVYAPVLDRLYYAARGHGAFRQDGQDTPRPIHVAAYDGCTPHIVASRSHGGETLKRFLDQVGDFEVVSMGSSLKLCLVAEGAAHLYPRLGPTMEWDTGAAHAIVNEAGGQVTDLSGRPLAYNKQDLLNPYFMVEGNPPYPWRERMPADIEPA